jgi:membrane dipeptidase
MSLLFVSAAVFAHGGHNDAQAIAQEHLIIDTHIDVPYRINEHWEDVSGATERGDFDAPRARAGGLNLPFMSIYIPAAKEAEGGAALLANQLIDQVEALVGRAPEQFTLVSSVAEAEGLLASGKIGLAMGIENGSAIEYKLENLAHFYQRGVRYITLTHSKSNQICDSSYDDNHAWDGLSPFGEQVVAEMNRLGIMVDISHVSDAAFFDVLAVSKAPLIATHSSARHFTPDWERNMSDAMIRALAAKGGVIQINIGSTFLTQQARQWSIDLSEAKKVAKSGVDAAAWDEEVFDQRYRDIHPYPYATLDDVLDHIDWVVSLVGVEHVGIGTDFDGVGDSLPVGFKDVSGYPNLIQGLLARGYTESDIAKILAGNTLRVWREVERVASGLQKS